jgi:hypothetical protein
LVNGLGRDGRGRDGHVERREPGAGVPEGVEVGVEGGGLGVRNARDAADVEPRALLTH